MTLRIATTFECSSAKRSVSSTTTRPFISSTSSPQRQFNTHTSAAVGLSYLLLWKRVPEVVKLSCVKVVAAVLCHAPRLRADIRLSNELRAVRSEVAKVRRKIDAVLLGISLERCANVVVGSNGNGSGL